MSFYGSQVYLQGISAITATRGPADPVPGDVRVEDGIHYRYIYNAGGTTLAVGYACTVLAPSSTGYSATISTAAGSILLGFCKHVAIPTTNYGWVAFKGYVPVVLGTTAATNEVLQADANGALAAGVTFPTVGVVNTTITSTGYANVYLA